jgi:hypothetical protein
LGNKVIEDIMNNGSMANDVGVINYKMEQIGEEKFY